MEGFGGDTASAASPVAQWGHDAWRLFQYYLDKTTPHAVYRWIGTLLIVAIYCLRVYYVQGFYIIAYGLGIYLLNLLIGFLSPLVDPELEVSDGPLLPTKGSDEFKPFIRRLPEFKFCSLFSVLNVIITGETLSVSLWHSIFEMHGLGLGEPEKGAVYQWSWKWAAPSASSPFPAPLIYCSLLRYSMTKAFCIAFLMTFFSVFDVPVFWPILLCYWIVLFVLTMRRQIAHMIKYKYIPFNIGKQKYGGKKPSTSGSGLRAD